MKASLNNIYSFCQLQSRLFFANHFMSSSSSRSSEMTVDYWQERFNKGPWTLELGFLRFKVDAVEPLIECKWGQTHGWKSYCSLENLRWTPSQFELLTRDILPVLAGPTRLGVQHKGRQASADSCQQTVLCSLLFVALWLLTQTGSPVAASPLSTCVHVSQLSRDSDRTSKVCVCVYSIHVCYAAVCWPSSLPRPEGVLPKSCQLLHSLGPLMSEWQELVGGCY